jgi:biofilm PGA synthesis N-glycosyltransferase PgaC
MVVLFVVSVLFVAYTYLVYPLVIYIWGSVAPRRVEKRYRPLPISVVLAVRDEETRVAERLQNLLSQDYPRDMIEIVVVSDGSTDRTVEVARSTGDARVRVLESPAGGKASAINIGVAQAANDIIVFADARQRFADNAFAELAAIFHDERVGAASGELIIHRPGASEVGEGVGLYWEYEKMIRRMESRVFSVVGATGSIYAIRKRLFVPLPPNTLLDDFVVPMRIVLQGFRVVFVRSARAYDWAVDSTAQEFARKVRTLAGNFQALAIEKALLNPARNPVFFQMVSHKVTRLFVPYFFVLALFANVFLAGAFFRATLILQLLVYATLLLRFTPLRTARMGGIIRVVWTFFVMNAAAVLGLWVFLTGKEDVVWKKGRPSGA